MSEALLRASGLGKRFPDGRWAVRGVDFTIEPGQVVVLAGRNGAGKTVLAKLLAGLIAPTEGELFFEGRPFADIEGLPASRVGYVFQDARLQLVGDRVADDVLFGPENLGADELGARRSADRAIELCGLAERRDAFVHTLSGGEQRRLALAGIIAMDPAVIILDEPFANLDRDGVTAVLGIVAGLAATKTAVLVVTHELEKVLGMADRLDVMADGRMALSGEPDGTLAAGVEGFGLRNPMRAAATIRDLVWLA